MVWDCEPGDTIFADILGVRMRQRGKGMSDSIKEKRLGKLELGEFSIEAVEIQTGPIISGPCFNFYGEGRMGPKEAQLVARFILEMVGSE